MRSVLFSLLTLFLSDALRMSDLPLREPHAFTSSLSQQQQQTITEEMRRLAAERRSKLRSATPSSSPPRSLKEKADDLRTYLQGLMQCLRLPGLAVGVSLNGTVVFNEAYGLRDASRGLNADTDTLWAIGSASKAFTGALAAKQIDRGMYKWDTKVSDLLPGFHLNDPVADATVSVRDLLSHRTGLPRHDTALFSYTDREKLVYNAKFLPPTFSLRQSWQYNNWMFAVAGYLEGVLNGTTWEDLVKQEIFSPLNMTTTYPTFKDIQSIDNKAIPAAWDGSNYVGLSWEANLMIDPAAPAGAIQSTAADMLKWLQFQIDTLDKDKRPLLSRSLLDETQYPTMLMPSPWSGYWPPTIDIGYIDFIMGQDYSLGWFPSTYRGNRRVSHGGNVVGAAAMATFFPDQNLALAMFTNAGNGGGPWRDVINSYATDLYLGLDPLLNLTTSCTFPCSMWPDMCGGAVSETRNSASDSNTPKTPSLEGVSGVGLEEYTGVYTNPGYGELLVAVTPDLLALNVSFGLNTMIAVRPNNLPNGDFFLGPDNSTSVSFWRTSPSGAVVAGTLHYVDDANYSISFTSSKYDAQKDSPSCGYFTETQVSYIPSSRPGPSGQKGVQGDEGVLSTGKLVGFGAVVVVISLLFASLVSWILIRYFVKNANTEYLTLPDTTS